MTITDVTIRAFDSPLDAGDNECEIDVWLFAATSSRRINLARILSNVKIKCLHGSVSVGLFILTTGGFGTETNTRKDVEKNFENDGEC